MSHVKPRRRYDSSRRRDQARQTRAEVLDAARRLFLADGYASTTIASVAGAAGVSVETVYKTFGNKSGLLRAVAEAALAGPGPTPTYELSDAMRARETDPYAIVQNWASFAAEVTPRGAPVFLVIRSAAATSPDVADLLARLDEDRMNRMAEHASFLEQQGHLRPGVTEAEARDVMWAYTDPTLYELLVLRQKWPLERFRDFLARALTAALLP
jgi:AcrR family transcriptional regulator